MRHILMISTLWVLSIGSLAAQSFSMADLLQLVTTKPAAFEQEMESRGYTCYQRSRTLTNWSCLFMNQRPLYLNKPTLAPQVIEYVFGPFATAIVHQTKSADYYIGWHKQLTALGFTRSNQPQIDQGVGEQYTKGQLSVVLRDVDNYNGISNNQTGYSASVTWMRQPPVITRQDRVKSSDKPQHTRTQ